MTNKLSYSTGVLPPEKIEALIAKMAVRPLVASLDDSSVIPYTWSGKPYGASFSLEAFCSAIEDQLTYGTCTANAIIGACEMFLISALRFNPGTDDLSRMFGYWWAGVLDNLQGLDSGRSPLNAWRAAAIYGLCKESTEPYTGVEITTAPSDVANTEALQHKLNRCTKISIDPNNYLNTVDQIKKALNDGYPVTMAFNVHRWVFYINGPRATHWNQPGPIPGGSDLTDIVGRHEPLIVAFKDTNDGTGGYFLVRNSWNTTWGDQGYWAMPYLLIQDAYEFWAVEGFDGIASINGSIEAPLTPTQLSTARHLLADQGLGIINSDGSFTFTTPVDAVWQTLAAALLKQDGLSLGHMAEVVGIDPSEVSGFLADPANAARFSNWLAVLK